VSAAASYLRWEPHSGRVRSPGGQVLAEAVSLDEAAADFPEVTFRVQIGEAA
jgi:hypothetical protein